MLLFASNMQENGYQEAAIIAILFLLAIFLHRWAFKIGLFDLHNGKTQGTFPTFKNVGQVFLIYVALAFIFPSLLFGILRNFLWITQIPAEPIYGGMFIQLISMLACLISIGWYLQSLKAPFLTQIWKRDAKKTIYSDLFAGICGFLVSYPVVLIASVFFDWIVRVVFQFVSYEQVAVKYLKTTQGNIIEVAIALFTIVIFAPCIEELLFRGFLQTFFHRFIKAKYAILFSGFLFALFHYSTSQSYGNFSVILTLFVLGCYLGVIYERQGSLLSVIFFHALFNVTSAWRILLDGAGGG